MSLAFKRGRINPLGWFDGGSASRSGSYSKFVLNWHKIGAKCFVSWSASPSLARVLSDPSLLCKALEDGVCSACPCQAARSKAPGAVSALRPRRVMCLGLKRCSA